MRKKAIIITISIVSILLLISLCAIRWYFNDERLDTYTMVNDGRSIIKGNNEYIFNDITDDKVRGKAIGKAEYNGEKLYIYKEKGKDVHNYIIIEGVDIGVDEEYIGKIAASSNK